MLAGLGYAFYKFKDQDSYPIPAIKPRSTDTDGEKDIKSGVVTWGGYAGGQYFNEGFEANKNSRFYKDYGFIVEFKVLDDFVVSRNAWKTGDVDLLWTTIDAFTTEVKGFRNLNLRSFFKPIGRVVAMQWL